MPKRGMMDAMHPGRNDDFIERALETDRQAHVAVMKNCGALKHQFIDEKSKYGYPRWMNLQRPETHGVKYLSEVKTKRRRDVQIGIDVMDIVEMPEQGKNTIGSVPVVKSKIHQEKPMTNSAANGNDIIGNKPEDVCAVRAANRIATGATTGRQSPAPRLKHRDSQ